MGARVNGMMSIRLKTRRKYFQQIAKAAGHSQISTALRYMHLRAEDTEGALESFGKR
ncbi:MAG: hypothetical protein MUP41_06430 [Desulfobacterales bacterium]|nr:hypothetical protein [Desulfobacterales bacterium]